MNPYRLWSDWRNIPLLTLPFNGALPLIFFSLAHFHKPIRFFLKKRTTQVALFGLIFFIINIFTKQAVSSEGHPRMCAENEFQ
jgi:hypothetical protein